MRLPSAARRPLEFNITPLIDVVFLLNIFFLVASYYIRHEQVDPVNLPAALKGQEENSAEARIIVTVTAAGELRIGGEAVNLEDAIGRVTAAQSEYPKGVEFRLRCDRETEYSAVEPLLLGAVQGGVRKVRFSVLPE